MTFGMLKNYATFSLFFFFTLFITSQNIAGNWKVISLETGGNVVNLPSTVSTAPYLNIDSFNSSPPTGYDQYWGRYINGYGICNSFETYYEAGLESINLIPYFETTDNICATAEEIGFESLFFSILQVQGGLTYSFYNNLQNLSIVNVFGEFINLEHEDVSTNSLSGEWFIYSIWEYDLLFENTFNTSLNINFSNENVNGQSNIYGSSICNGFNAYYDNPIQTNSLIIKNMGWTLLNCNTTDEQYFESAYVNFFNTYSEDLYTYEISGSGLDAILQLNNGYEGTITYGRQALSVDDVAKQSTKLITDRVENKLQIISNTILTNSQYTIFDIAGRQITSARLNNTKHIDLIDLTTGIYFLTIKNSSNQMENFKFFKD